MQALLTAFLIMVPAPAADGEPVGVAPTVKFLKWIEGAFESTETVMEFVPQIQSEIVVINGQKVAQNRTVLVPVMKTFKTKIDAKGAEVYGLDGKKVDESSWQKTLGSGAVTIVARDGQLPHPGFLKVFKEGTLIVVIKPTGPVPGPPNINIPNAPKR